MTITVSVSTMSAATKASSLCGVTLLSQRTVYPRSPSAPTLAKLTVSDLPMLSCQYIQKGVLLPQPQMATLASSDALLARLEDALSRTLARFPMLAGRFVTDEDGFVYLHNDDSGVLVVHAVAYGLGIHDVLLPGGGDVPEFVGGFFALDGAVSYDGHFRPLAAVQVTELADGVFIGASVNHAVCDGTSFWNFFNAWAETARGCAEISRPPETFRFFVKDSEAVLRFENGWLPALPKTAFRERLFHFSRRALLHLKALGNKRNAGVYGPAIMEVVGNERNNDLRWPTNGGGMNPPNITKEVSSFQSLCALIWKSVTRARKLPAKTKTTTFRLAVNCRRRLTPPMHGEYFGNAIQSVPASADVAELLGRDIAWAAELLHRGVLGHVDTIIRERVEEWEESPRVFPLGNADGASITMGSSAWFPMYENDFGWGRPLAVRSGRSNKFDGKMSAFPGRDGAGSVDVEMCLAEETMALLECDKEFMHYVTC